MVYPDIFSCLYNAPKTDKLQKHVDATFLDITLFKYTRDVDEFFKDVLVVRMEFKKSVKV